MPKKSVNPLHIAIDARMYGTAQRGIGRYLMKLIEHLEKIDPPPQSSPTRGEEIAGNSPPLVGGVRGGGNCFTIFLRRANFEEYIPRNPNFTKALWDVPWYGWREQMQNAGCRMQNVDLVHFPHWNVPLFFRRPFVVTIHDLELFSSNRTRKNTTRGRAVYWLKHLAFRIVFRHAVLASKAIIVPSNAVREQLLDQYPQARKKVQVIYEAPTIKGIGYRVKGIEKTYPVTIPYYLYPTPYILYVGAAYPHKNLPRLLEAWSIVHAQLPDYKLVLVGREDFFWKKLKQQREHNPSQPPLTLRGGDDRNPPLKVRGGRGSYDQQNHVIFYGAASDDELAALYKNAALLVQPSLEEGFSLPPLEALAHGTPAAVSDIPVHREILDKAAAYFNPLDPAAMAKNITDALQNPAAAPLPRAYSWKANAEQTLAIYATAIKTNYA